MKITYDDTRDMAIRCIDKMISKGILKEDEHNFETQDIIQDEINKVFGLDIDDNFEVNIQIKNKWEYKTCDRCPYDVLDEEGDVLEHHCIDDELYKPIQ